MADLAMQLARAAAARTLANWAEPDQQAQATSAQPAQPRTDREPAPAAHGTRTAAFKQTDPAVLFTRFAAIARDCIALESRLAAGTTNAPKTYTLARRIDRRRNLLRDALYAAAENHPECDVMRYETIERLNERLAADPDETIDPTEILEEICEEFGLEVDWANMPDELLFAADKAAPDPHATSPP